MLLCNNQPFLTTHRAKDSFGDSLKYKLVTPNDNSGIPMSWVSGFNENEPFDYHGKFSGNPDLPFPWGFHFNKITGDMKFKPVNEMIGLYTVEVTQYKDGNISSRVRRDVHKRIIDCPPNQTLELEEGLKEQYLVCANDTLVESLNFTDPDQSDSIYFKWLDTTGIPGAVFTSDSGIGTVYGHLYWQPDTSHISPHPYYATYFAKDNACPIIGTHARTINVYVNPEPEVTFNADIQSCGKVEFNADILNIDNGEFEWKINGNKVSSEDNFVKNLEPGTYPYSLKLTGVGCERVFYDTIVVPSFLTITAGVDTNICDGENYMLKPKVHNPEGNEDSVKFWVNNTSFFNSTVIEPTSDTTLIVVAEDVAGCLAVDSVHIDFYSLPEPDISDKFFCAGEGLDTASTIHFIDYNIEWRRANGQLLDAGANFPIPEPGNYELHIIDKELSRCSIIEAFEVIQDENVSFNTTDTLICKGFNMQINAGVNGISYQWRLLPDNQILSNNNQLNYTVEKSGEILIEVIRTIGNMFCAYSDTFLVDAGELPDSNIVHPGNKCINEGYVSLPEKANAINRIEWSGPGVMESKIWNLKSAGAGLHQLEYTVTHDISGCELKGIKELEIYNKPELSFKIDPITGEVPLTALLEADNINSLNDKKWTIQSDTGYQRTTYHNLYKFEHIFNKPGTYTITFSATDSTTGCRDTVRKDSIVNVYLQDNDTSNLLLRVNSSFLNVYPNPAGDVLYIHSLKTLSSITLTTITGREVRSISPKTNEVKIERKELTPGSYILQVKHIDGSVERKQVIFR